jgi:hypothetical protein
VKKHIPFVSLNKKKPEMLLFWNFFLHHSFEKMKHKLFSFPILQECLIFFQMKNENTITQPQTWFLNLTSGYPWRSDTIRPCVQARVAAFGSQDIGFQDLGIWLWEPGFQDLDKRTLGFTLRTWVSEPRETGTRFHSQNLGFRTSKTTHPTVVLSFSRHFPKKEEEIAIFSK